ncbi:MAG TPA: chemotaxis protein CheW [Clostridia bacterium]|nr:chemotaxis protein CheW [Clostridia bacterium]
MTEKILTFYLGECLLGINLKLAKEINRSIRYTPVPGAKPHIIGFFNMRGQVVTLFDLARLLGINRANEREGLACIILKSPKDPDQVGFLIDRPGDVIEADMEEYELPPANIGVVEAEFIESIVKLKEELLIVISPDRIISKQYTTRVNQ